MKKKRKISRYFNDYKLVSAWLEKQNTTNIVIIVDENISNSEIEILNENIKED